MKKTPPKKFSLLIINLIVITLAIFIFIWINLSKTIEQLAKNQINETTEKVETKLNFYFDIIRTQLLQIKELTDNGKMDAVWDTDMNYLLFPIFNTSPQITTFALARTDGDEYSLLREDSTWLNNFVYETDSGMNIHRQRWQGSYTNRQIIRTWEDYNAGYDPRTRHWFKGAASAKDTTRPFWSKPYKILFQTFPGITVAMKAKSQKKGEFNVVQWDVLLSEITHFTQELSFSQNGRVFLLSEDFEILGLPKDSCFMHDDSLRKYTLMPYDSANYKPMTQAVNFWKNELKTFNKPYHFYKNNEKWWGYLYQYQLDNGRYFILGIIVPEADFVADVKRSRLLILICSIIVMIFILIIAKAYFDKQKANKILREQKQQIEQQNEEIITQNEEITTQHALLQQQNKDILNSIQYAQRIQQAVLPSQIMLQTVLPEHFIMFKPKDVVSGDFYWFKQIEEKVIVAAVDCTGHGVPGAFMSMLGISFLNEIISKGTQITAGQILDKLRYKIKTALKQEGKELEQKDGMDAALCIINYTKLELQYAGAFNPLYLVRKDNSIKVSLEEKNYKILKKDNMTLLNIKADKQPVAVFLKEQPFTTQYIKLYPGDLLYVFSDGFTDQIGGKKKRKFQSKNFQKLLLSINNKQLKEQHLILEKTLKEWRADNEQIDDILVIGIRI